MVSVGGVASGIDTKAIIQQLIAVEQRPIAKLQSQIKELNLLQAAYAGLGPSISGLKSAAKDLTTAILGAPKVTGGDESALGVSVNANAISASHDVVIHQLAKAHRLGSQGVADANKTAIAAGAGTFTVQAGASGAQISVAVTASTTLNDLANSINAADGDVTASVINDGTMANAHRLVLTSKKAGTANQVVVATNNTTLDFTNKQIEAAAADSANAGTYTGAATSSGTYTGTTNKSFLVHVMTAGAVGVATYKYSTDGGITWNDNAGAGYATSEAAAAIGNNTEGVQIAFSNSGTLSAGDRFAVDVSVPTLQAAQDAVFDLDGIRQTRQTNTVDDAVEGVTLDFTKADATKTISFGIDRPKSTVTDKVDAFVKAYNTVYTTIRNQQQYDKDDKKAGVLLGESTANGVLSELRRTLTTSYGTGSLKSLMDIGIKSNKEGKLEVDKTKLESLLGSQRTEVIELLASVSKGSSSQIGVVSRPSEVADGSYAINVTTAADLGRVDATGAQNDTLAQAENLTFTYTGDYTAESPDYTNFSVALQIGDTLGKVVDRLNSAFKTQSVGIRAFNNNGTLRIETDDYGADQRFTVVSTVASGAGTTRIGNGVLTGQGVDIAGTIDGQAATGLGEVLTVDDEQTLERLAVSYVGTTLGSVGSVTLKTGIGARFVDSIALINEGTDSLISARDKALSNQVKAIEESIAKKNDQIAKVQQRLEKQFAAMEKVLGGMKGQADFLSNQLTRL